MATSPAVDRWVSLELIAVQESQTVETVFQYQSSTPLISQGELIAFINSWATIMTPLIVAALSNAVTLLKIVAKTHNKTYPNVEAEYNFPVGTIGSLTGDVSPGNVTIAVKLLTGIIGRSYRGRQFWFGIAEGITSGNRMTSAGLSLLAQLWTRHLLGFSVLGIVYVPAVASRVKLVLRPVLEITIELFLDSMRRRLTGRGS